MELNIDYGVYIKEYGENIDREAVKDNELGHGLELENYKKILGRRIFNAIDSMNKEFCMNSYLVYNSKPRNELFEFSDVLEEFITITGRKMKGYRSINHRNFFKEESTGVVYPISRNKKDIKDNFEIKTGTDYEDFINKDGGLYLLDKDIEDNYRKAIDNTKDELKWED